MRILLSILTILLLSGLASSQKNRTIYIPVKKDGDTARWYSLHYKAEDKLKLDHIVNLEDTFYFRFWAYGRIVEIWSIDYKTFNGSMTNYARKFKPYLFRKLLSLISENYKYYHREKTRLIRNTVPLDTSSCRQIYELFKIVEFIPTCDSIKEWGYGCDGSYFYFETSTPEIFTYKKYWSPDAFDSLPEAKLIQCFIDSLFSIPSIDAAYSQFHQSLPPGPYKEESYLISIKFSARENRKYEKHIEKSQ